MISIRGSAIAALLGLAALASTPARADLIIKADGVVKATDTTNTFTSWTCAGACSIDGFTINLVSITGVNGTGGNPLMDNGALDVAAGNHGQLTLDLIETNLTAGGAAQFLMSFSGVTTTLNVDRSFYLDTTNSGLNGILLATYSTTGTISFNKDITSLLQSLTGAFSITEEIVLHRGGAGSLSEDDKIAVPEPAALSIFGLGLLALGAMGWRRRKTGNFAA
jgi:hypothetical protein